MANYDLSDPQQYSTLVKVLHTNASYKTTADILSLLIGWNISVSIENSAKSFFFGRPAGYKSFCSVFMMAMTPF